MRIGLGYDIHRLVDGRPFVLGGVTVPHDKGPLGHSDGDALLHAVADALLGAAGLGDIGSHFPDTDPAFKDADSTTLLRETVRLVRDRGYRIVNIDTNVLAQAPKLSPYREAMCATIAEACGIDATQVSVKMRTGEGLDAVGRGEAVAAQAIVLLETATLGDN
jgi:2-C-methyl-D-erythritol 2,4-cyclodiphosphate synthase